MAPSRQQQVPEDVEEAARALLELSRGAGGPHANTINQAAGDVALPDRSIVKEQHLRDAAEAAEALIDPMQVPNGRGRYYWLNPAMDEPRAAALRIAHPLELTIARENGHPGIAVAGDRLPVVVYHPNARLRNPDRRPNGPGRFEYLTTGPGYADDLANVNLGGQHIFLNNNTPSAEDVWRYRGQLRRHIAIGEDVEDDTEGIDIVWVPAEGWNTPPSSPSPSPSVASSSSSDSDPDEVDPITGLTHDPLNRNENDQTGNEDERIYQTRLINGKKYTVDRSRTHANNQQQHKSWTVTKKGLWRQYPKYGALDWSKKDSVEKLNKWREQEFSRNDWPHKRTESRDAYTDEERKWLFDHVEAANGDRPSMSIRNLAQLFNDRFNPQPPRNDAGIQGVIDRLRTEYRKYGRMKAKPGRGQSKKRKRDDQEDVEEHEEGDEGDEEVDEDGDEE